MSQGANTIALHYYGSMFPDNFWGSIFIGNWGSHGASPTNRSIGVVPRNHKNKKSTSSFKDELEKSDKPFLTSQDTLFRPVSMVMAPDGGLYLADWHSRDDDSNLIGRVFKISYTGKKQSKSENIIQVDQLSQMDSAELCDLLGNPNQAVRERAKSILVQLGNSALESLGNVLESENALAAANAIWTLTSIDSDGAAQTLAIALNHPDPRIRSLGLRQLRQFSGLPLGGIYFNKYNGDKDMLSKLISVDKLASLAEPLIKDPDGEVRIEAALALNSQDKIRQGLLGALEITNDKRLRYQIGFELGRHGDLATLTKLRNSSDPELRRVASIAAETARNENNDLAINIKNWDFTLVNQNEAEKMVAQIEDGKGHSIGQENQLMVLNWLEEHPPKTLKKPVLEYFLYCLGDGDSLVKEAALRNIDNKAFQTPEIKQELLSILHKEKDWSNIHFEALHSLGLFEDIGAPEIWVSWLKDGSQATIITALRSLRELKRSRAFMEAIWPTALSIAPRSPLLAEEIWYTFRQSEISEVNNELLPLFTTRPTNKNEFAKLIISELKGASSQRGRWSFSNECSTCHSVRSGGGESLLGPNLSNIGVASQPQYLIESILEPNKVLKTGFQVGTIETKDGQVYSGQMETKNGEIVIRRIGAEPLKLPIGEIKSRTTSHLSIMPEGLDDNMSTEELADLTAYLHSLKD
jgi:putative heme-binding domain-containing protein